MLNKVLILITSLFCSFGFTQDVLKVAMSGGYPPWNFTENNTIVGFEPELITEACKRLNKTCDIEKTHFTLIQKGVRFKKFDLAASGLAVSDNTRRILKVSKGYAKNLNMFVSKKDSDFAKSFCKTACPDEVDFSQPEAESSPAIKSMINALKGKKLGIQKETAIYDFVRRYEKWFTDVEIKTYPFTSNAFQALEKDEVDTIFVREANFMTLIKGKEDNFELSKTKFLGGVLGSNVSIISHDQAIIDQFNEILDGMKSDGTLTALSEKWFGKDITP